MKYTDAELPRCIDRFRAFPLEKQLAAFMGIAQRIECGEYDPENHPLEVPYLRNYLFDERWTLPLRPRKRKGPDTTWAESLARGEVDLGEN